MKEDITVETVIANAIQLPIVNINRSDFLRKELRKYYSEEIVEKAINTNPARAGISKDVIYLISNHVISYEAKKITAISTLAGIPSVGPAAIATAAGDITSYFAFLLRSIQELAYLYGFEEFNLNENEVDSETMNVVLVFIGTMFGVQGASNVLWKLADSISKQVTKELSSKALTKGAIYPIVKKVAKSVGVKMTKQLFADGVAKVVPVAGGLLSGGLTYATFKPCCKRLRDTLMTYNCCDPMFYQNTDEEYIDVY